MTTGVSSDPAQSASDSISEPTPSAAALAAGRRPLIAAVPERTRRSTSLWRLRPYIQPFVSRFVLSFSLALVGMGLAIAIPLVTRAVIDGPIADSDRAGLYILGLVALSLGVAEAVTMWGRRWVINIGTVGVETMIRKDLYDQLQRLPMGFHGRWDSGQLLSRVMNDLAIIRRFIGFGLTFMVVSLVQIAVVTALLIQMYWPLGLVVLGSSVPIVAMCLRNKNEFTRLSRQVQDGVGDVASTVEESVQGLRVIKAFGRASHLYGKFDARSTHLYDVSMERVKVQARFWTFLEVVPTLTLITVLGMGAWAAGQGQITVGTLVAFITLMLGLIWPVAALGFQLAAAQEAMTAADRIAEVLDAEVAIADGPAEIDPATVRGRLQFHDVTFRFDDAESDLLRGVDLDIAPGETLALVGGTGSGKTLLTGLVARLHDVSGGSITIDGVDVREYSLRDLRTVVATAFEDPTLFSMSARENLTLGRPDASEEDVAQAIDIAQAHFVYDLPWGLDTRIGEQGMSLSGGQRQRLALARAILGGPRILVLDDTLSALDIHTEELVEAALKSALLGVTGIVVAHRASTVMLADRVAMISDGRVSHVGTHSQLLAEVPEYRELLSAEFNAENEFDDLTRGGSGIDDELAEARR